MFKPVILVAAILFTFGLVATGPASAAVPANQLQADSADKAEGCKCTCPKCKVECDHHKDACTCPKCQAKCECKKKKGCDCPHKDCPHHKDKSNPKPKDCPHKHKH